MRVLVTGAAGFIGSHLAERLITMGHEVIGLDNFSPYYDIALKDKNALDLKNIGVSLVEGDLRTHDLVKILPANIDAVFHLAAHPGISKTSSFEDYFTNNFIGTQRLLEYALDQSPRPYFVNIATSSIYGLEATYTEAEAPKPASWYGVTKLAAEQLVLAASREGKIEGTSFRLYSVYGPRERPDKLYTRLIDCGINAKPFPLYEGSLIHLRSFTYIDDIIDGIVSALEFRSSCDGEIFNLGTEKEHTTEEGIKAVERLLATTITCEITPPRPGDQSRTKANIDKARRVLKYDPRTTLIDGLKQQIDWFKHSRL